MFGFRLDCLDLTGGETVRFLKKNGMEAEMPVELGKSTGYKCHGVPWHAGVVELADTGDLKSPGS